jgi:hypothetical protein
VAQLKVNVRHLDAERKRRPNRLMQKRLDLFWRFRLMGWREIAAAVIVLGLAAVLIAAELLPYRSHNFGFGPEWECTSAGQGEPVCVKTAPDKPN